MLFAGMSAIDDSDLEKVTGGATNGEGIHMSCPNCFNVFKTDPNKKTQICPFCSEPIDPSKKSITNKVKNRAT